MPRSNEVGGEFEFLDGEQPAGGSFGVCPWLRRR